MQSEVIAMTLKKNVFLKFCICFELLLDFLRLVQDLLLINLPICIQACAEMVFLYGYGGNIYFFFPSIAVQSYWIHR